MSRPLPISKIWVVLDDEYQPAHHLPKHQDAVGYAKADSDFGDVVDDGDEPNQNKGFHFDGRDENINIPVIWKTRTIWMSG